MVALALFGGYLAALLATTHDLGYSRDEGFYFHAARSYAGWLELLGRDPDAALQRAAVDRFWGINHEHPALMKSLFALSHALLYERWHWFREAGTAFRFPGMVVSSLALPLVYLWGRQVSGRWAGFVAALLLGLMPRVFYHGHLACFDLPVASLWLLTTFAYWLSLVRGSLGWALLTSLFYGLLLDTKHNAWLLPLALVLHYLAMIASARRSDPGYGTNLPISVTEGRRASIATVRIPLVWVAMALVSPGVFYLSWPWIWYDTVGRLAEYASFHLNHEYYNMEFLGVTYWKPPMPRSYAWVMTLATVPAVTWVLGLVGLAGALGCSWAAGARRLWTLVSSGAHRAALVGRGIVTPWNGEGAPRSSGPGLWLACLLLAYAPWLSPKTPIFGGTKHWLVAYPFLCLFAGCGFALVSRRIAAYLQERGRFGSPWGQRGLRAGLVLSVASGPLVMTIDSHPWGLTFYTPLVGGASGAANLGLNRTFWGYTTGAVADELNQQAPPAARIYVHDTAMQSFDQLVGDGRLRSDLHGSWHIHTSDYALYHHEPHMSRVEHQIWVVYGTRTPRIMGTYHGVPVVWAYARPTVASGLAE